METNDEIKELKKQIEKIEQEKELSELKEKIKGLEHKKEERIFATNQPVESSLSYRPIEQNLQSGFKELGDQIGSMPHVMIPTPKDNKIGPGKEIFNKKEGNILNKLKKLGLIISILIVAGYVVYRVLKGWIF